MAEPSDPKVITPAPAARGGLMFDSKRAAHYLGISRGTLIRWAHQLHVTSIKIGDRFFFLKPDLIECIEQHKTYRRLPVEAEPRANDRQLSFDHLDAPGTLANKAPDPLPPASTSYADGGHRR